MRALRFAEGSDDSIVQRLFLAGLDAVRSSAADLPAASPSV
jgi:hypothetical protein